MKVPENRKSAKGVGECRVSAWPGPGFPIFLFPELPILGKGGGRGVSLCPLSPQTPLSQEQVEAHIQTYVCMVLKYAGKLPTLRAAYLPT